jgi:hypothetical protein
MAHPAKSSNVPGQYFGYSQQTNRCLIRLLEAPPGSFVSIEYFDDVGVESADGQRIHEQAKTTVADNNPVSDRAVDLWKTFAIWVRGVRDGSIDVSKTRFVIHTNKEFHGNIVDGFHSANTKALSRIVVSQAIQALWGDGPEYKKKQSLGKTISNFVEESFLNIDALCQIVESFELSNGLGDPSQDIKERLRKTLIPPDLIDEAIFSALGWIKARTDALISQGKPAIICVDDFRAYLYTFSQKHNQYRIFHTFASQPTITEVDHQREAKNYVRQLEIIECEAEELMEAITDYLRAEIDRTMWSQKGWVDEQLLDEYEEKLKRVWRNALRRSEATLSHLDACKRGRSIYTDCVGFRCGINGVELPDHFIPGSFHALADVPEIGWHPDYQSHLTAILKKNDEHS